METNRKSEPLANERMELILEEFNQELKAVNQVNNDLVRQVNILNSKVDAVKNAVDKPKPITVNADIQPIEQVFERRFAALTDKIPKIIPVEHHHHFDKKDSKKFITGGLILLLVTAITAGLSLSLWSENKLLHENALKYRMIRQVAPAIAHWADSVYFKDPQGAEQVTSKEEADEQTLKQAEADAREKQQAAEKAKKEAERLRKHLK